MNAHFCITKTFFKVMRELTSVRKFGSLGSSVCGTTQEGEPQTPLDHLRLLYMLQTQAVVQYSTLFLQEHLVEHTQELPCGTRRISSENLGVEAADMFNDSL